MPEPAAAQAAAREATPELAPVSAAPSPLLEARDAVDELLASRASAEPAALAAESFAGPANIQGVGISVGDEISSLAAGAAPGESTLTVYVAEPTSINEVRSVLVDALGVTAAGDNVPIQVVVSGVIEAYRHDFRERPPPGDSGKQLRRRRRRLRHERRHHGLPLLRPPGAAQRPGDDPQQQSCDCRGECRSCGKRHHPTGDARRRRFARRPGRGARAVRAAGLRGAERRRLRYRLGVA